MTAVTTHMWNSSSSRSHLRMTKRGRAVLLTVIAAPLVASALFFGINAGGATATSSSTPLTTITVPAGESLWQIAAQVAPHADRQSFIADVVAVNQLSSVTLQPGQTLKIPAKYEH
jgi:hypothetical protein